jgi:hypothetical protein
MYDIKSVCACQILSRKLREEICACLQIFQTDVHVNMDYAVHLNC